MENLKRANRKIREGVVVSNKMQKTVTVKVERTIRHPHFEKTFLKRKSIMRIVKSKRENWAESENC